MNDLIRSIFKILESEADKKTISKAFSILNKIQTSNSDFYSFFEHNLISSENEEIRLGCFRFILNHYSNIGENSLIWSIRNEDSTKLLKMMVEYLDTTNSNNNSPELLKKELNKRLKRLSEIYNLDRNEIIFLLDLVNNVKNVRKFEMDNHFYLNLENNCYIEYKDNQIVSLSMFLKYSIPKTIVNLKRLKYLDLSYNYFKKIPKTLKDISELNYLDISWNELEDFPEFIKFSKNSRIVELNLAYNYIKEIPIWISNLKNLISLDLSNNNLQILPEYVFTLPNLECINISNNNLKDFPSFIRNFPDEKSMRKDTIHTISRSSISLKPIKIIY